MNDFILPIISYFTEICLNKEEVQFFTTNYDKIQHFFYDVKLKYPKKFNDITFNTNGYIPFSEDISDFIFDLKVCGSLASLSPAEKVYIPSRELPNLYCKVENEDNEIKEIAQRFYNKLGCDQDGNIGKHTKFNSLEKLH